MYQLYFIFYCVHHAHVFIRSHIFHIHIYDFSFSWCAHSSLIYSEWIEREVNPVSVDDDQNVLMHVHCTRREHSTFNGLTCAEEQRQRWITNKHKQITPLLTQFESTRNALMPWLNFWNQYEHKNIIAKARVNGNRSKGLLLYDSLSSWLFLKKRKTPRREKSTQIEVYAKSFSSSRSFTFVCVAWSGININCRPFKFCGTKKVNFFTNVCIRFFKAFQVVRSVLIFDTVHLKILSFRCAPRLEFTLFYSV